jgi:hypothetical protein
MVLVPENTPPSKIIESFLVRVNPGLYRGISCRLYPKEAREFFKLSSGFQTNLKDLSRCELKLVKPLDFEAKSAFVVKIVAEVRIDSFAIFLKAKATSPFQCKK